MYIDITYIILVLPAILLTLYAQAKVKSTFNKYLRVSNSRGVTGVEAARAILQNQGIHDVNIERADGHYTDHYDPRTKTIRLSSPVYDGATITSVGVAAHEVGHAIQHNTSYSFLVIRHSIFPVVNISSRLAMPLILLGLLFSNSLVAIGILLFSAVVLFQLVTLPVEFNASKRALAALEGQGILSDSEIRPVRKVLSAAALTYVAAAAVAVANLLRLLILFTGGNRRRR
ncbi:MAG: zinc metallopeptidase [Epulopiscium sp.]|jgi:Zn-dependent membrane protease YugP|nr:zinc metallopeptidase [Candidatus Epulonipiscium sp.]